jgi:hypothetical protein
MTVALICQRMHWTWDEYLDAPLPFIAALVTLFKAESEAAKKVGQNEGMGGATAILSIVITAIDDASAQLAGVFNGVSQKATTAQETITSLGTQLTIAGATMAELGSKVTGFMQSVIDAGSQGVAASDSLNQTLSSLISTAQQDTASKEANLAATQKLNAQHATLTAQLELEQQTMQKDIEKYGVNSPQVADAAAKIQTYEASLQKVNDALNQHTALLDLAGASVAQLSQQFTSAADANVKLGFNVDDSLRSFQSLMQATHDVTQSMDLNTLAMNLARDKQEDLGTATNQVVQILEGGGKAAKQFGINMSETATPAEALAQLTQMLGGQAQAYADGPAGKAAIAQAEWNKTMEDAGTTILPIVDALIEDIGKLVAWVDAFTEAHPKLAAAILVGIGVFGGLLLVLGSIMLVVGPLLIAFGTMGGIVAAASIAIVAAIAALAVIVRLIVEYHKEIWNAVTYTWNAVIDFLSDKELAIYNTLISWGAQIANWWNGLWNGIYTAIENVWSKIQAIINTILAAVSKVTGAVSGIAGAVGGAIGGAVGTVVHAFAAGGIVNSPTLALVGEAGPEAIIPLSAFAGGSSLAGVGGSGAGGGINIYIQGGNYLDSGGATMIADAIGKQIMRQLKLKNFS